MDFKEVVESLPQSTIKHYKLDTYEDKFNYVAKNFDDYDIDTLHLYHGTLDTALKPVFGKGKDNHDYGRGLYTTLDMDIAKEWASTDNTKRGYVYEITLDFKDLSIFNFSKYSVYNWLAELMSHRMDDIEEIQPKLLQAFINKYKQNIKEDVVIGWRADSAFFTIVALAANSRITENQLDTLLRSGKFGYQVFIKSAKAFDHIVNCKQLLKVEADKYISYTSRCNSAIEELTTMISNTEVGEETINFSTLVKE